MRTAASWVGLALLTVAAAVALDQLGLPSATLFAALLVGLAAALLRPRAALQLPSRLFVAAQAVLGVTIGGYLDPDALEAVAGSWLPVTLVSAGTLGLSIAAGAILARTTELDRTTAILGSIAGGASGIVGMARDLGGDDRLVAFMQYLRVLVVVLITPLAVVAFGVDGNGVSAPQEAVFATPRDWLITAAIAPTAILARRLNVPAGMLMGPLLVAGALTLAGLDFVVPPVLRELSFALIGLQVGLRFTLDTVRLLGRLLLPVLAALAGLLIGSFGLAVVLHLTTDVTLRDAYLATTPGGIYAVLAIALGAEGDTTFIVAVQSVRVLVSILIAPLAVRGMARAGREPA